MKNINIRKWAGVIACVCTLGLASQAIALSITPTTGILGSTRWDGTVLDPDGDPWGKLNPLNAAQAEKVLGLAAGSLFEAYKSNSSQGGGTGSDEKDFASSYVTTFSNGNANALVDYISGNSIAGGSIYFAVKDGVDPYWYIFDITGWNGTDDIDATGFWPGNGAVSHVSIFTGPETTRVPDGGSTLMLIGLAVTGLGLMRRKLA